MMDANDGDISDGPDQAETRWYADHDEIVAFAYALVDAAYLPAGQKEVVYFFEKPWKWSEEHRIWAASGRPDNGDGTAWEMFLAHLEAAGANRPPVIGL